MSDDSDLVISGPKKTTQMAVIPPKNSLNIFAPENQEMAFWSSLDPKNDEEYKLLFNLQTMSSSSFDSWINKDFICQHVFLKPVEKIDDETGEVWRGTLCILANMNGETVRFASKIAQKSIQLIAQKYGPPPWPTGLVLTCIQQTIGDGQRMFVVKLSDNHQNGKDYFPKKK
jgi:hypothetical protein